MIRKIIVQGFILSLWVGCSAAMLAQSGSSLYNRASEKTISGIILHVVSMPGKGEAVGVHLDMKTPDGIVNVHLAPAMFIGEKNFWFFADEPVEITGVRASHEGNTAIVARLVTKGGKTLTLRNENGTPEWTPSVDGTDGCGVTHPPLPRGTEM